MAERKTPNKGYQKLKSDLSAGNIGQVYIFYGEESYLREYYLGEIKKKLVPAGFEEFNYHRLSGKTLTMQELNEAVEAMPMMAERTLIVVTDCDLFKLPEEQRTALIALLNDFPPYCCLVFVYDLIEYKPSKTYKKLYEALDKNAQSVKFEAQERSDLINWIGRRFRALGKGIDAQTAEHLIFTCGALMTGLVPEIEKIGAYAKGKNITTDDINAVADPVLDDRKRTGRRAPPVRAWLERHVDRRALNAFSTRGGIPQSHHLGVRTARLLREAPADHPAVPHDDGADRRIGRRKPAGLRGLLKRKPHPEVVVLHATFIHSAFRHLASSASAAFLSASLRARRSAAAFFFASRAATSASCSSLNFLSTSNAPSVLPSGTAAF